MKVICSSETSVDFQRTTVGFISGIQINIDDPVSLVGQEGQLDNVWNTYTKETCN
jgi:hypothetical protein